MNMKYCIIAVLCLMFITGWGKTPETEWHNNQYFKCRNLGGVSNYNNTNGIFSCTRVTFNKWLKARFEIIFELHSPYWKK